MSDSNPTGSQGDEKSTTARRREISRTTEDECGRSQREAVPLIVVDERGDRAEFSVQRGRNLRRVLSDIDRSPYTAVTSRLNCGGRGICATCGVRVREGPSPEHWHDRLADRFRYPRLSCQVTVDGPMTVELVEKRVWGPREAGEPADDR